MSEKEVVKLIKLLFKDDAEMPQRSIVFRVCGFPIYQVGHRS